MVEFAAVVVVVVVVGVVVVVVVVGVVVINKVRSCCTHVGRVADTLPPCLYTNKSFKTQWTNFYHINKTPTVFLYF